MGSGSRTVTQRVIAAVARETDTDPLELPPLYTVVDGDSLEAIVESLDNGSFTFTYAGVRVRVTDTGTIEVTEPGTAPERSNADALGQAD